MSRVSKIVAGSLLGLGVLLSLRTFLALTMPPDCPMKIKSFVQGIDQCELAQQQYKQEAVALFLLMGMPSLLSASGIFWQDHRNFRQQEQNRLRATFFNLLQENNGHITTLRFAMAAGLEGRVAKAYLDDWAKEFNAAYNISEEGNVIYHFDLGDADRQFPESI